MLGTVIQIRRDTSANWISNNPVLAEGECGFETDTGLLKISQNGTTAWNSLPYFTGGSTIAGEANTMSNIGTGAGEVYKQKDGINFEVRTIKAGANIVISNNTNDITISATSTLSNLDGTFKILNTADNTKIIDFDASNITTGTTRTITMADRDIDLQNMGEVIIIENVSILSASWTDDTGTSGYWLYDYANANITANDVVEVNFAITSLDDAKDVTQATDSSAGSVRLYAKAQPTENLTATVVINKGTVI